ncbi:PhzF family phenazine biosynthesis protein [Nonomuraea africana]|uniref:PhzF family phenazine biosynthesis protein n=1 Tax=Nonomuraea africana TaxID=46171 RepID=A0ABR9KP53_9ACTN|nr:PhzF family phenazine biosynthesis protein [Nonomuraea africana]MBE1563810.1 PhzF family phenazine biosynthesis protein [Nonomuraea africana]
MYGKRPGFDWISAAYIIDLMRLFTVDAFTDTAFHGNPAAVCLLNAGASDTWMQSLATEMGLSETAFLLGNSLRWFTPAVEVSLSGHATLATAHVLYSTGAATGTLQFTTKSGILTVNRSDDGLITMDFPAKEVTPATVPDGLEKALGAAVVSVNRSQLDLLVELESEESVRSLRPDIPALEAVDARGVIVTAAASSATPADYVSRFFAPRVGVPEDPVTGSAHCALAPFWSARLGRDSLLGAQLSARGGMVHTTLRGDRVDLAGRAVTILEATLHLDT